MDVAGSSLSSDVFRPLDPSNVGSHINVAEV